MLVPTPYILHKGNDAIGLPLTVRDASPGVELRLDLGGGLVLQIVRR